MTSKRRTDVRVRRGLLTAVSIAALAVATLLATAPAKLEYSPGPPAIDADPADWLAAAERRAGQTAKLIPGVEKRIRWFGDAGRRTPLSLVYLHGFSATRMEIAPVAEIVADRLAANLFETRLAGHGRTAQALAGVRAEDWLDDAVEALTVGAAIGERLVVIGTSTGATLALAVADHPSFAPVDALVMISPNFAPRDGNAEMLLWPGGAYLARLLVGTERSWTPANERQARYWSTTYPTIALVEMMRLVDFARSKLPLRLAQDVLTLYSPDDRVVDVSLIETSVAKIDSRRKETVTVAETGDPGKHVLAGDILAPENNEKVADLVVRFVSGADL